MQVRYQRIDPLMPPAGEQRWKNGQAQRMTSTGKYAFRSMVSGWVRPSWQ